jgi:hypothetical protein
VAGVPVARQSVDLDQPRFQFVFQRHESPTSFRLLRAKRLPRPQPTVVGSPVSARTSHTPPAGSPRPTPPPVWEQRPAWNSVDR